MGETGAGAVEDAGCHPAQQEVDRSTYFSQPVDRGATGRRDVRQQVWGSEPACVHGCGERLEMGISSQILVEVIQSLCSAEQLRCGFGCLHRAWRSGAAADELHLGAHSPDLCLLQRRKGRELGDRE